MSTILRPLLFITFIFTHFHSFAAPSFASAPNKLPSLAPIIQQVSPAVVNISVSNKHQSSPSLFSFLQPKENIETGSGIASGVIVDAEKGYIITNYHVIENANQIIISLTSGEEYKAAIIGQDPHTDIALLKIHSSPL